MDQLFSENIPIIEEDVALQENIERFGKLDPIYVATCSIRERKEYLEQLWAKYQPFADNNFIAELKVPGNFNRRTWELYLGATLLDRGYQLEPKPDRGPDLKIIDSDGRTIWVEATAPDRGVVDSVPARPEMKPGKIYSGGGNIEVDNRPRILRITGAVREKYLQYQHNLSSGLIGKKDPFILAINGNDFAGLSNLTDYLVKWSLFAAGPIQYKLMPSGKLGNPSLAYRPKVEKRQRGKTEEIECGLFNSSVYEGISAVIFSMNHVINTPKNSPGSDLIFVRNPYAKNPIRDDFWLVGREWISEKENQQLRCVEHDEEAKCGY